MKSNKRNLIYIKKAHQKTDFKGGVRRFKLLIYGPKRTNSNWTKFQGRLSLH